MINTRIKTTTLICALVLSVGGPASATPMIKDFSSTGGRTQNKTGPKDRMYLAKSGDKITFAVKGDGADKYEWQVNKKVDTKATGESFVLTVPNEKGIWEIRLTVSNGKEETHQEWVVSTLTKAEAPIFFDYFTDGKWRNRTETDPWARKLPEWKKNDQRPGTVEPDTSGCVMKMNGNLFNGAFLYAPHGAAHGTWKCKIRVTPPIKAGPGAKRGQGRVTLGFYPLAGVRKNDPVAGIRMAAETQGHNWAFVKLPGQKGWGACACYMPLVGAWGTSDWVSFADEQWKDVKAIRTPDGYICYWKGTGMHGHNGYFNDNLMDSGPIQRGVADPLGGSLNVGIIIREDGGTKNWGEMDCIEIYRDKFISPRKITYGKYVNSYKHGKRSGEPYNPKYRTGIILDGFGVGLADIAQAIGDKSLFRYDADTKTANCYIDICVRAGGELILKDETLRMHCQSDGEHQIRVKNGATIKLENSTVTSPDHYYKWIFPSEFTPSAEYSSWYQPAFTGRFIARNSTIDNCGGIYFSGPTEVVLENTKLTNLVEAPYPPTPHSGFVFRRWSGESGTDHSLTFRGRQVCSRLLIKGCEISAKVRTTLRFMGMDAVVENTTIYDTILRNVDVSVKKAYISHVGRLQHPTTLNLVNTRFGELLFGTDKAFILPKYYLDVKVVDVKGRPVPGAKVSVVNEVDGKHVPENVLEGLIWVKERGYAVRGKTAKVPEDELIGRRKPTYCQPMPATTTGKDGHTPLPKDPKNTMILTDFVQDKTGKKEFTYTITVEAGGKKKVITGVNPGPDWYRPDPNKPTYTITAVLDGKTVTEAQLKK